MNGKLGEGLGTRLTLVYILTIRETEFEVM